MANRLHRNRISLCTIGALILLAGCIAGSLAYLKHQQRLDRDLIRAVRHNDLQAVRMLLDRGADPDTDSDEKPAPSTLAVLSDILHHLFRRSNQTSHPPNALFMALEAWWKPEGGTDEPPQNTEIVKLLIARGANVNCRDSLGVTPLIDAALSGRAEIVRMLLARGAEVNVKDSYGFTAYDYVSGYHQHLYQEGVFRVLQQAGGHE